MNGDHVSNSFDYVDSIFVTTPAKFYCRKSHVVRMSSFAPVSPLSISTALKLLTIDNFGLLFLGRTDSKQLVCLWLLKTRLSHYLRFYKPVIRGMTENLRLELF